MSEGTGIQWTDETWNPVTGCRKVSPGCEHCYAEGVADRFWATQYGPTREIVEGGGPIERPRRFTDVWTHPDRLDKPLRWTKPRRVFVNSMSDLFHEDVPDTFIAAVFGVMASAPDHTFQILTKRPKRMREWFRWVERDARSVIARHAIDEIGPSGAAPFAFSHMGPWPLPNVHLGVSVEDQQRADERVPILLDTPAAVRWVSAEPLLGPVDLTDVTAQVGQDDAPEQWNALRREYDDRVGGQGPRLDWVVVGGESGPGARPCDVAWIRQIVAACQGAGVPSFVKQLGARAAEEGCAPGHVWLGRAPAVLHKLAHPKGGDPGEWPADLRVREMPTTTPPETTT